MTELPRETTIPRLPPRNPEGHKGTYGRVLIVAGSEGMAGAAGLAGIAALRGGAGLVTVACPRSIVGVIAGYEPSYLTLPLPEDDEGRISADAVTRILDWKADVVAVGPGLGQGPGARAVVADLVRRWELPLVLDADGLNALVGQLDLLGMRKAPTLLSPHVGEFSRLTGLAISAIQEKREEVAVEFARRHQVVVILKGHGSVVTDGERLGINETGNPGMATGGTGDVLTGLLAALMAQGMVPFEAARLAAHVHGLAGDILAERSCPLSLIASDLLGALPEAWLRLDTQWQSATQERRGRLNPPR